jgi:hypothetical protein
VDEKLKLKLSKYLLKHSPRGEEVILSNERLIKAFSPRKLTRNANKCIRIIVEGKQSIDIGFNEDKKIDEITIKEYTEGKDFDVLIWYDQSGNNSHLYFLSPIQYKEDYK